MATRRRNTELSPQLRSRICKLRSLGYTYKKIHQIYPEVCFSTIITTCQRESLRINNKTRSRTGAPRKLSEEQRDYIYDIAIYQNPHIINQNLIQKIDRACRKRSIQKLLREMDRRKWRQRCRPEIKQVYADKRLEWARTYESYTSEMWQRVKWSNECLIERGVGIRPIWTFLRASE